MAAAGVALGGEGLIGCPFRRRWRIGGDRTSERWQQPLVGAAKGIPAAASWLEADLKGEPSMVRAWLGHGRPHPRPVWSVQLGMAAGEGGAGWLGCAGGGARRAK